MQQKPGYPVVSCNIKMPDNTPVAETLLEEEEPVHRRQQLINFAHTLWGFKNWSWAVTKQDLDFVEISNGKYTAGVCAFVSVTVKTFDIHRENVGYATSLAPFKGSAIHNARKCAVTNALRETLLSFGGNVANELLDVLDTHKHEIVHHNQISPDAIQEINQNVASKPPEPKNIMKPKEVEVLAGGARGAMGPLKNVVTIPSVAKTHPMPANLPPTANRPPPTANAPRPPPPHVPAAPVLRPNSNEVNIEDLTEEEARLERKRRQKLAQEEFRLKQLMKQKDMDGETDVSKNVSLDKLLMAIPSQAIVIDTGDSGSRKRKSPAPDGGDAKRPNFAKKVENYKTD